MNKDELIDLITIGIARACVKEANGETSDKAAEIADVLLENGYRKAEEIFDEVEELLEEIKDDYRADDEIRKACGVRYAMIKVEELKKEYVESEDTE